MSDDDFFESGIQAAVINFPITPRLTPQFATAKSPCSTVYRGEIVIVHSELNHGDAMWMAEIALDLVVSSAEVVEAFLRGQAIRARLAVCLQVILCHVKGIILNQKL
ncbi:hypothetical protein DPMN_088463 [Dreissena polymorpha]|uniref:Uncharacterized protein n=1 Tax=Dreissena polymorpha TaxID=45954 RepID=A0A9D4QXW7_DREPO|nr:hypothetical protein DPMN_088463 [Dreissena polymorpha]